MLVFNRWYYRVDQNRDIVRPSPLRSVLLGTSHVPLEYSGIIFMIIDGINHVQLGPESSQTMYCADRILACFKVLKLKKVNVKFGLYM